MPTTLAIANRLPMDQAELEKFCLALANLRITSLATKRAKQAETRAKQFERVLARVCANEATVEEMQEFKPELTEWLATQGLLKADSNG